MTFVGRDGNAFALMAAWRRAALDQGWAEEAIDAVLEKARDGDYQHLLNTLLEHSTDVMGEGEETWEDPAHE